MILKSSNKYIIKTYKNYVLKISKDNKKNNILKEYKILSKLSIDNRYKQFMPRVYELDIIKKGILKGNYYYKQSYINSKTFSQIIKLPNFKNFDKLFINVSKELLSICNKATSQKKINKQKFIKNLFKEEINLLNKKNDLNNLFLQKNLIINDKTYHNLGFYLNNIYNSKMFKKYIKNFNIVNNEHWNFHGDNVLINKKKIKLIDPDTSINFNETLFSYSRFLYSYIHDTCFYKKYLIKTKNFQFVPSNTKNNNYKIEYCWPNNVKKRYEKLFSFINDNNIDNNVSKILGMDKIKLFRLKLIYLFCLVRGINKNYQNFYMYIHNKNNTLQIDHIFLYLNSIIFAKQLLNYTLKYEKLL